MTDTRTFITETAELLERPVGTLTADERKDAATLIAASALSMLDDFEDAIRFLASLHGVDDERLSQVAKDRESLVGEETSD